MNKQKPMLILLSVLTGAVSLYFYIYGFSTYKFTRYCQYAGIGVCVLYFIDTIARPGD